MDKGFPTTDTYALWEWVAGRCKEIEQRPAFNFPYDGAVTILRNSILPAQRMCGSGGRLPIWIAESQKAVKFNSREKAQEALLKNKNLKIISSRGKKARGSLPLSKIPSCKVGDFLSSPSEEAMARLIDDFFTVLLIEDPRKTGKVLLCSVISDGETKVINPCFLDDPEIKVLFRNLKNVLDQDNFSLKVKTLKYKITSPWYDDYFLRIKEDRLMREFKPGKCIDVYALKNR